MPDDTASLETVSFHTALADRTAWTTDNCPVRRSLELVGTQSAMLLMREAYYGTTRFDDFAARVGITEAVAAARLRELTEGGLLRREPYRDPGQRTRHEYRLTPMGRDFAVVVLGLFEWGSKYLFADGDGAAPVRLRHTDCGTPVHVALTCDHGEDVSLNEITVEPRRRRRTAKAQ